jgi:hypothetical protein
MPTPTTTYGTFVWNVEFEINPLDLAAGVNLLVGGSYAGNTGNLTTNADRIAAATLLTTTLNASFALAGGGVASGCVITYAAPIVTITFTSNSPYIISSTEAFTVLPPAFMYVAGVTTSIVYGNWLPSISALCPECPECPELDTTCYPCKDYTLNWCGTYEISAGLANSTLIYYKVTDNNGNVFLGSDTTSGSGVLDLTGIDTTVFTPYGTYTLEAYSDSTYTTPVEFTINTTTYECLNLIFQKVVS